MTLIPAGWGAGAQPMNLSQQVWTEQGGWMASTPAVHKAQLVLVFGSSPSFGKSSWIPQLKTQYPEALIFGCSTAGEIAGTEVSDGTVVATAIELEKTSIKLAVIAIAESLDSEEAGRELATQLPHENLAHVFVLSDGQQVNGSKLVRGIATVLPDGVHVTGGLAGDGDRFETTFVLAGETPLSGAIAAIGLYGDAIRVGFGSRGGWDPFGPERTITRSAGNVLYELDNKSALGLYKSYLGEHADGLPATGFLFPMQIQREGDKGMLVRTILNVDEEAGSLTFAGDVPVGAKAQLMKTNFDSIVEAASGAARATKNDATESGAQLAIIVSCVGRKLVLKQRTEEEIEAVASVLGPAAVITGFYSYGEVCPSETDSSLQLHNQTMTVTTLHEEL